MEELKEVERRFTEAFEASALKGLRAVAAARRLRLASATTSVSWHRLNFRVSIRQMDLNAVLFSHGR